MTEQKRFLLFLVNTLAGLSLVSGKVGAAKYVCPGDSTQLFQNVAYDLCNGIVSLELNGNGYTTIANWLFKNCSKTATFLKGYNDKVFLHQNRTISFHDINHFDNGNYIVKARTNASESIQQVQIFVMVAPGKDCRPKINRSGNTLHITGTFVDCGDPITTAYWKEYDGVSDSNEPVIEVTPGNERRTYTACMKGQALQCAQSLKPDDYCSSINIEGSTGGTNQLYQNSTDVFVVVIIVLGMLLLISAIVIAVLYRIHIRNRTENNDTRCKENVRSFANDHHIDVIIPLIRTEANVTSCNENVRLYDKDHQDDESIPLIRTVANVTSCNENVSLYDNDHQDDESIPLNRVQLSRWDRFHQDNYIRRFDRMQLSHWDRYNQDNYIRLSENTGSQDLTLMSDLRRNIQFYMALHGVLDLTVMSHLVRNIQLYMSLLGSQDLTLMSDLGRNIQPYMALHGSLVQTLMGPLVRNIQFYISLPVRMEANVTSGNVNVRLYDKDHQDDESIPLIRTEANVTSCNENVRLYDKDHQDDESIPLTLDPHLLYFLPTLPYSRGRIGVPTISCSSHAVESLGQI